MTAAKTLALIDASGYLYRAFHALPAMTGPGGRPTNATLGFANMLRKYLAARRPDAVAVAFDRPEKTFRHDLDAAYKAQRAAMPDELVPQIEDAKTLCRAMGLAVVEEPGYEADDLIATLATRGEKAGLKVEIASADKDLFQLVRGGDVVVWHPMKEKVLDARGVEETFGVPPERVVDVLALMGDASDNIPGVAGIGEKGARDLVASFGSLDEIYARLDEVKGKRRDALANGREDAFRSRTLATVHRDAPAPGGTTAASLEAAFGVPELDVAARKELLSLYETLGFSRLKKELLAEGVVEEAPAAASARGDARAAPASFHFMEDPAELRAFVEKAVASGRIGLHVESAPGRPWPPKPLVAAVALEGGGDGPENGAAFPLCGAGLDAFSRLLAAPGLLVVAHDVKRLFLTAAALAVEPPRRVEDAMLDAYVVAPGLFAHDLAGDARGVLDLPPEAVPTPKELVGAAAVEDVAPLGTDAGLRYLEARARLPLRLADALLPKLSADGGALRRVLDEIELPLVPVLSRMERAGVAVDRGVLAAMSKEFEKRLATLEAEIHEAAGERFNVGSPAQLGKVLFEKLGFQPLRKTAKTKSYATGSDILEELVATGLSPVPKLVLEWREISKLKGTYVDALPNHVATDGRIHTRYDQAVAATGRLSSNDPNLQNIPVRTEAGRAIRKAFVAPPGRRLVAADYSQIELRLLAHLSGDEALIDFFRKGEDIHRATAAKMFGAPLDQVTPDQRRSAKTINFGVLYGMGPFALAGQLGVSQADAKAFIKAYFDRFPKIRACLDGVLERARETGGTATIFGRVRPIPGLSDRNHAVRANAERMAMNAPFQGSAADLIKKAMIALDARLSRELPDARLLLQVHDELVVECAADDVAAASQVMKETMEGVATLSVPLTVDVGHGTDWASAK